MFNIIKNNEEKLKKGEEIENKTERILTIKEKELTITTLEKSEKQLKELKVYTSFYSQVAKLLNQTQIISV